MHSQELETAALLHMAELDLLKSSINPDFAWYPYGIRNNFIHLKSVFDKSPLDDLCAGRAVPDIGAADGDLAFFLEKSGRTVEIIDHAATNFNGLRGVRLLAERLGCCVVIHDVDSETGLMRLFDHTGWDLLTSMNVGDTTTSDPARPDRDERCFALPVSRYVQAA